eukprot:3362320-Pyramimonas_sp.AAC.1
MASNRQTGQISCKWKVVISVPSIYFGYPNKQSVGGGGSHENQCVVLGGGYAGASKEKVKANGVAEG